MNPRTQRLRTVTPRVTVLVTILLSPGGFAACGVARPVAPAPAAGDDVMRFAERVNAYRESVGCGVLAWHSGVARVAQEHSEDMVSRGFFAHINPDGQSPGDRLDAAGVEWNGWAENIAFGQRTPEAVLRAWLESPSHLDNIEDCSFTHHGVGLESHYWTHVFLR